jgi:RES domain-containing protein
MIANAYLEGTYSEVYSEKSQDEAGIEAVRQTRDEIRKQVLQLLCNSITVSQREYCTVILRRVSNYQTLDGTGGLYVSGRWHTKGHPVVYCTMNPATALLETLVHMEIDSEERPERFQMLRIEGPDTLSIEEIEAGGLAPNWAEGLTSTQSIGDRWLSEGRSLLLQVPGILVPETWNVLVNPQHAEAKLLEITMAYEHVFDARLL